MKTITQILLALSFCFFSNAANIFAHFSGNLKKAGTYEINEWSNLKDLERACGGWTPFSSVKNLSQIKVIRFPRREGVNGGANIKQRFAVIPMSELPMKDGKYQFQEGDLVYIPARVVIVK